MKRHWSIFISPEFILGLILLLVNDHYLKNAFHNSFTGKLSDFAGLFIFPLFFSAFLPGFKKHIYWITAIGFIWWKLPLSSPLIESWNQLGIFSIQRIIDYTDLFALGILPFSYGYFNKKHVYRVKFNPVPVIILSSFAFIATSRGRERIEVKTSFNFEFPKDTLQSRLFFNEEIRIDGVAEYREKWKNMNSMEPNCHDSLKKQYQQDKLDLIRETVKDTLWINVPDTFCNNEGFEVKAFISSKDMKSSLTIETISHYCYKLKEEAKQRAKIVVKEKLIDPLYK